RRLIMRRWIRGSVLFAAGLVLGMITIKSIEAQQDKGIGLRVNHVGIYVKNLQESVDFYTKTRAKPWRSCENAASPCPSLPRSAAERLTRASMIRTECALRCLNSLQGR